MELYRTSKAIFFALLVFWQIDSLAQQKMDLAKMKFTEDMDSVIKDIPNLSEGKLGGRQDMTSYGFENGGRFTFAGIVPGHIELLSWRGTLVGYAFKIKTFADQKRVEEFFKNNYRNATFQTSKWMNVYHYKDDKVNAALRTIIEEKFKEGASGYLDLKRIDFSKEFDKMMKR